MPSTLSNLEVGRNTSNLDEPMDLNLMKFVGACKPQTYAQMFRFFN